MNNFNNHCSSCIETINHRGASYLKPNNFPMSSTVSPSTKLSQSTQYGKNILMNQHLASKGFSAPENFLINLATLTGKKN